MNKYSYEATSKLVEDISFTKKENDLKLILVVICLKKKMHTLEVKIEDARHIKFKPGRFLSSLKRK